MENTNLLPFVIYTTSWCGDCIRTKQWLEANDFHAGTDFTEIDIEKQEDAAEKVIELNQGNRSVPTVVFSDGSILTEPSNQELEDKLL